MIRNKRQVWALKSRHGYFVTRGPGSFQEGLPTALFKTLRHAKAAADSIDPHGKMVRPVKVCVTVQEVLR
jgi:hypothetical protein